MNNLSRRSFLKTSALGLAASAFSARSWAQVAGANGDLRVAVVGVNSRGRQHIAQLNAIPGVRVVAICDVDQRVLDRIGGELARKGVTVEKFTDYRKLLEMPGLDVVTLATPNHWHALGGIWALQAGKDVLVEKPVSHNVWEGRQLVAAAKKYNRIAQAGTQSRSSQGVIDAVAWVRAGNLGKITASRGFCYKRRDSIGKTTGPTPVPASIDYDLWSGPAPLIAPHRNSPKNGPVHYDWHWFWAYGNGDIANQGVHQMDIARWFLGEPGLPRHTWSVGGRLGYDDDGETPNTHAVIHDYATAPLIFEVRGLPSRPGAAPTTGGAAATMDKYRGVSIGNVVDCEGGYVVIDGNATAKAFDRAGQVVKEFTCNDRLMANFIEGVRSRKAETLFSPIEDCHVSSAICHLGNISHRLGQATPPDRLRDEIKGDPKLAEAVGRMTDHLAANSVDFGKTPLTLGQMLTINSKAERLTGPGADAANRMLARDYRAPFTVPQIA